MNKNELRSYFLKQRNTLSAEIREELSVLICNHILSSAIWKEYDDILMYVKQTSCPEQFYDHIVYFPYVK